MVTTTSPEDTPLVRILVVDDNPAIHRDFQLILGASPLADTELDEMEAELFGSAPPESARSAFELDYALQGDEAVEKVSAAIDAGRPFSVAFVDVRMPPGQDGIKTIAQMWGLDPRIQAVICTAYSDHTWDDIVRSLGHSDGLLVLRKPFDAIEALQAAHALARKWVLTEQVRSKLAELDALVSARTCALESANADLKVEIHQRRSAEDDLKHLATHDSLTGLPNRVLLNDRLSHALAKAKRLGSSAGVMLLDLDNFKDVNDRYGHSAGDQVLKEIAERLTRCARDSDTVTRMGGDEFVVVLEDLAHPDDAALVAKRMLVACSEPVMLAGHAVRTPPSIGIALYPHDCSDPETLLKSADLAMYQAKSSGKRTYRYYAQGMLAGSLEKLRLRDDLAGALSLGQLELWYQPLHDLSTGRILSMEALVRWNHPELGQIAPMRFIPLAEATGVIVPLGTWVLRTAVRQLAEWRAQGASHLSVAVNVSARQLLAPDFCEVVLDALKQAHLPAHALELEITETAATEGLGAAAQALGRLAEAGVRIAIDDFGSGYSSFARLKELPVSLLKLDRSLIRNIAEDPRDAAIVSAIVAMARMLGLTIVAEGVETEEQLNCLKHLEGLRPGALCCDRVQGFLLNRPLPVEAASTAVLGPRVSRAVLAAVET